MTAKMVSKRRQKDAQEGLPAQEYAPTRQEQAATGALANRKAAGGKKRGRKPGFTMSIEHRTKIKYSMLLKHLIEYAEGSREMSPAQAKAGLILLNKVLPDLPRQ